MGRTDNEEGEEDTIDYSSDGLIFGRATAGSFLQGEIIDEETIKPTVDTLLIQSDITIKDDPKRWLVLLAFCSTAWVNSILWITFAPISDFAQTFYGLQTPFWINFQSLIFFVMYVPGVFLASWVLDHHGLRFGINVGAVLFSIGSLIRVGGFNEETFFITCIGQTICAISQPFIQNAPAKVAAQWFPDKQRALATTIASVSNPVGGALGLVIPPLILYITDNNLTILLIFESFLAFLSLFLVLLFFRSRPIFPPSKTALQQQINDKIRLENKRGLEDFKAAVKTIFQDKNFIILFLVYSLNLGAFQSLATLVNQLMSPFGYSSGESGGMGAMVVVVGVFGAAIAGKMMDKFRAYKLALLILLAGSWFSNLVWTSILFPDNFVLLTVMASAYGFFIVPVLPLTVAVVGEVTYPIAEATPVGFIVMGGMAWSAVLILLMSGIVTLGYVHTACYLVGIQSAISYIILLFFQQQLKRTNHELEIHQRERERSKSIST